MTTKPTHRATRQTGQPDRDAAPHAGADLFLLQTLLQPDELLLLQELRTLPRSERRDTISAFTTIVTGINAGHAKAGAR